MTQSPWSAADQLPRSATLNIDTKPGMNASLHSLMTAIATSHERFANVWESAKVAELRKRGLSPSDSLALSMEELCQVNHVAYSAAEGEAYERDRLLKKLFDLLPNDPATASAAGIDTILDFLDVDVPAHRCGYAKAWYYHRLKRVRLSPGQIQRLRNHSLRACSCKGYRPEIRRLARLMVKHADAELIAGLTALANGESEFARRKASRILQIVLNGRTDLRPHG